MLSWSRAQSRRSGHGARAVVTVMIVLYVGAILAWNTAIRTPVRVWWVVQFLTTLEVWLYLPLPLLIVLILATWQWRTLLVVVIPLVLFLGEYGTLFLPWRGSNDATGLRIMTWNLLATTTDAASLQTAILAEHPDVIAMQELNPTVAAQFVRTLYASYPYQLLYPGTTVDGLGVLSRFAIVQSKPPQMDVRACRCLQVTLRYHERDVTILNVHPHRATVRMARLGPLAVPSGFSTAQQDPTFQALSELVRNIPEPLLVVGDFNTTEQQPNGRLLASSLRDAFREVGHGLGLTYAYRGKLLGPIPAFPVVRIDAVLHSDAWMTSAAWNGPNAGSDHRSVVAVLQLR